MNKFSDILVVGNFGYANHDLSGQTIKTRVVYEMLAKNSDSVGYFDTQTLKSKTRFFSLLNHVIHCKQLVYLPAHGNLKYLFPLYYTLSILFSFDIIYCVIGGWLVQYLKNKPLHRYMLKHIKIILAETRVMKKGLIESYKFKNVDVMDNFRATDFIPTENKSETLKLVFMARVHPIKGLDTILNFCDYINSLTPRPNISMTFFGPLTEMAGQTFLDKVNTLDFVEYKGELDPDKIYPTLTNYDVMLLPTHYTGEGLPGTVIDSYLSGIPVIVSEWQHAREFVEDGVTGYIVPFYNHQDQFNSKIIDLYNNRKVLGLLKKGATKRSSQFKAENAWNIISKYLK